MQQQKQQEWGMRESTNFLYALVNVYALAITPFIRKAFGKEAIGIPGLFTFLLILVIAGFNGSSNLLVFLCMWLVALACQRIYTFRLLYRGVALHSRYPGWPALAATFTLGNWSAAVFVVEPLLCAGVSAVCYDLGERVLGGFFLGGAASLFLRELFDAQINSQRLTAMRDARIEAEYMADEYRRRGY